MRKTLIFLIFSIASTANAKTFFGGGTFSRQGNSENTRWTLGDWLTQKKEFSFMDHWLAMNKQANFIELNMGGGQSSYDLTVGGSTTKKTIDRFSIQLWVSIFGLQYTQDQSDEDWQSKSGQLNVRLFGQSSKDTTLTAFYGIRKWDDSNSANEYENQFGGARLNLLIVSMFGLEGSYRKDLKATDNNNREIEGSRVEYGVFFDLSFVRLYANQFVDKSSVTTAGVTTEEKRDGLDAGVKFYF